MGWLIGDGMVSSSVGGKTGSMIIARLQVSHDAWQSQRKGRDCVYMLSISHVKMDDDDVIFLISTSRPRNLESSSHCVITPLPRFLIFSPMKSPNFSPSVQCSPTPHCLISEVTIRIS